MLILDNLLSMKVPSLRDALRPIVRTIYELIGSILFTILFVVSLFRILNGFRIAILEIIQTAGDVYKSVREIYDVFANLLQPLALVWRFLVVLSARTHGAKVKR